jgi:hypothetical protein
MACLLAAPAIAADAKVDAAIKAFDAVAADPAKLKSYCAMTKAMEEAGDDEKKSDAASAQYMKDLGPDFESAWNAGENVDENSADGKALSAAMDKLDEKCPD